MIHTILAGYDGSESAEKAFTFAEDLAKRYSATLHVLAVARAPEFGVEVETETILEQELEHFNKALAPLKAKVTADSVESVFEVVVGHPAEQIIRYAEAHDIDHIVVGHRGRTLFERWLIGSVARQIIAYAHCAVTVVRE